MGETSINGRQMHRDSQPSKKLRRKAVAVLAGAAATCVGSRAGAAVTYTWNGGSTTDNLWTDATNWGGTAPSPSTSSNLVFAGTTNTSTLNNFAAGSAFDSTTFSAGAGSFVLNGNGISMNGNVTNSSTALQTIDYAIDEAGATRTYTTGTALTGGLGVGDLLINSVIADGGVTLAGPGQATLTGANTYTGVTTFNAGTTIVSLIGNGGTAGNLGAATNAAANLVFNGGTLRYTGVAASTDRSFTANSGDFANFDTPGSTLTLTGGITGAGGIGKFGVGTLVLSGASTNTGTTDLASGTLKLDYSATGAPASILNAGNAVNFSATGGSNAFQAGASTVQIQGGASAAAVTQAFGLINGGNSGSSGHLVLTDSAGGGPVNATFTGLTSFSGSSQRGSFLDITEGAADSVTIGTAATASTDGVDNNNGVLNGESTGGAITLNETYWANLSNSTYGTVIAATETNDTFTTTTNTNVTKSEAMSSTNTLRFDSSANNADIALTITGQNTRTNGILEPSNFGAHAVTISATGVGTLTGPNLRTLEIAQDNTAGDMTISAPIAGVNINKSGAGRLILSGANTITGNVYIDEGTLQISSNANLGLIGGTIYASNAPQPGDIYDDGTLEVRGTFSLDGSGGVAGIASRSLTIGASGGTVDVNAGNTFTASGGVDVNVVNGGTPLSGALTKTGAGTLVLSAANSSAGGLVVNGGTVVASASGVAFTTGTVTKQGLNLLTATGTSGTNTLTIANASLLSAGQEITGTGIPANTVISSISGTTVTISNALTAAASGNGYSTYLNAGTATFINASNTLNVAAATIPSIQVGQIVTGTSIPLGAVVTAVNTAANTVTINQNTTAASAAGALLAFGGLDQYTVASTAGLVLGEDGGQYGVQGPIIGIQGNVVTTGLPAIVGTGSVGYTVTAGANYSAYDSVGTGPITVNSGTLDLGGISHLPVRTVMLTGGTIQNGTLTGNAYNLQAGTISANLAGTGVPMTKSTGGTVTLSGIDTFTGPTTLTGGTLNLLGSLASGSAVSVGSTSTLTGTGTAAGTVAVGAGGTVIPGSAGTATGILSTGSFSLDNTTGSAFDVSNDSDGTPSTTELASSGAVSLGSLSTLSITDLGVGLLSSPDTLTIITGSSLSGTFLGLPEGAVVATGNPSNVYTINYTPTSVILDGVGTSSVPEPASLGLLAVGGASLMRRKRRSSSYLL